MAKVITFFNHKGGVGKTTVAHNLGVALTKIGKNILLVDADPQMNLTASVLGLADSIEYADRNESKWQEAREKYTNIKDYLEEFITKNTRKFESKPINLFKYEPDAAEPLFENVKKGKLELLCGDIKLFDIESTLYNIATRKSGIIDGSVYAVEEAIRTLGEEFDYILIDTSPSASSILNGVMVMMSDYFIAPVFPNFFSLQAIDNLYEVIKNWINLLGDFRVTANNKGLSFQPKFLGIVINMAKRVNSKKLTENTAIYSNIWKDKLNESIENFYLQVSDSKRTVTRNEFISIFEKSNPFIIEELCDFTGQLRSISEISGTPIVDLTQKKVLSAVKKLNEANDTNLSVSINTKNSHYTVVFDEVSSSYSYIAKCISKI